MKLRFFAGLTDEQAAESSGHLAVERHIADWAYAKGLAACASIWPGRADCPTVD